MKVPDTEEELRWGLGRFLSNAAKKHSPARVIIIIDGVNRLKSEGMPDGALHWVPTELPPCVRFILSSVELERLPKAAGDPPQHRTFVELARRKCPLLRIEPLSQQIRNNVIHAFLEMNSDKITLNDAQQFKIISAPATSQPMYLRSLLQAVCMCSTLTSSSIDQLLETFLHCSTAHELVDKNLNICCQSVFPDGNNPEMPDEKAKMEILGKIFTIVYISRTGLTESEIWGVIRMVTSIHMDEVQMKNLLNILAEFTMVVDGMHSFSHEIYNEVVYDKYICSRDNLIRWHQLMARYFSQLETGPRKLVALPYHLEVAGSWGKVKNCLTDINMFQLWWTRDFKADFIKTWAQLTKVVPKSIEPYGTIRKDTHEAKHDKKEASRPTYDVVEEYVKSLDEWMTKEHPDAEAVATIILLIADFLLEFATLGHENNADVPHIIHPFIPPEDLEAIGVPHIRVDDAGRSVLFYPDVYPHLGGIREGDADGTPADTGGKAIDDIPFCTTYFFHRWMWIQYPFIALGNCNTRFIEGEENKKAAQMGSAYAHQQKMKALQEKTDGLSVSKEDPKAVTLMDTKKFKLPEIKFNRKAARSIRRVPAEGADASADKFAQRMQALQDDIQNYREEYDFVMQMKAGLRKRLAELSGSLETLKRSEESVHQFDDAMAITVKRDKVAYEKYEGGKLLNRNLKKLYEMCERHPPNLPALILEIERKIDQDAFLLQEIKKRLWEQKFEHQMHMSNFKIMKFLNKKGESMHNKLLECRIFMKKALTGQAAEYDKKKTITEAGEKKKKAKKLRAITDGSLEADGDLSDSESTELQSESLESAGMSWDEMWGVITSRTGIAEPSVFFDRLRNGSGLTDQINSLKKQAETKLESMKTEIVRVEEELENTRLATMNGSSEESDKEAKLKLIGDEKYLRTIKEKAESQEQLESAVIGGLGHLGELLGVPVNEEGTPVSDLLRDIETMVDTLMEEREKQLQQSNNNNNNSQFDASSSKVIKDSNPMSPEVSNRPPELDLVLQRFESPKLRLPPRLTSKPSQEANPNEIREDDDDEEEGTWDRGYVMSQSLRFTKMKKLKEAKATAEAEAAARLLAASQ